MLPSILAVIIFGAVATKLFWYLTSGSYKIQEKDVKEKTFVVTGATAGIGLETVRTLAENGGRVLMLCRNTRKANEVVNRLKTESAKPGSLDLTVIQCDTSDLSIVRQAADQVLMQCPQIHALINNAGIGADAPYGKSPEGYEKILATNHLGHVLLTELLMQRLKESAPSRIVSVTSLGHKLAGKHRGIKYGPDSLNLINDYWGAAKSYNFSKLAQVHCTRVWAKKLQDSGVTANVLHPGAVATNIWTSGALSIFARLFKSAAEGAQTTLYLAVAPEVKNVSGHYFSDCAHSKTTILALDDQMAQKIYDKSLELVKLDKKSIGV